jgi:hypothetical protein
MSTSSKASTLTAAELDSTLGAALGVGDGGAAQAIGNLALVQQARASRLAREVAALRRDGADDADVREAELAVQTAKARAAVMTIARLRAATPAPEVTEAGWALQGRVFDADGNPAPGFTVFLTDQAKAFQAQYGYAFTDDTGFFLIDFAGDPAGQATNDQPLIVTVSNARRKTVYPVHPGDAAFDPAPGSTSYQDIVLPAGEKPLGEAPGQVGPRTRSRARKT